MYITYNLNLVLECSRYFDNQGFTHFFIQNIKYLRHSSYNHKHYKHYHYKHYNLIFDILKNNINHF